MKANKTEKFFPIWIKIFLLFSLLIVGSSFLTITIASFVIRDRFDRKITSQDRHTAELLARRIDQILSEEFTFEFLNKTKSSGFEIDLPPNSRSKPGGSRNSRSESGSRNSHPEMKHKERFSFIAPQGKERDWYKIKLLWLRETYGDESVENLIPILIHEYPYLLAPRRMHDESGFPVQPLFVYRSLDGEILYSSQCCQFYDVYKRNEVPLLVNNEKVGTLFVTSKLNKKMNPVDQKFLKTLILSVVVSSLSVLFLAALIAYFLIRKIFHPIHHVREAVYRVAEGDFSINLPVKGNDEIAQLSSAFNQMAHQLVELEQIRKQMVSDISHELRTPVALLKGRLEMMIGGHYPASNENLMKMDTDLNNLSLLINQVHELAVLDHERSVADKTISGQLDEISPEKIDFIQIAQETIAGFSQKAEQLEITLLLSGDQAVPLILGSIKRAKMVLSNLIVNALHYTPAKGQIMLQISVTKDIKGNAGLSIVLQDNGCGVADEHLLTIFDRFFRIDSSRSRASGGSGLGLALVQNWVLSMNGTVYAENNQIGGLSVIIQLPI